MSFLIRATPRFATATRRAIVIAPSRTFSVYGKRTSKETDLGNPDSGEQYEKHKEDLIKKVKEGKGHWKPELASVSEENVAAERYSSAGKKESLEELQKRTVQHVQKKYKHGTSQDTGM